MIVDNCNLTLPEFKPLVVEKLSTHEPISIDRFKLSRTWYNLLMSLSGKNPSAIDKKLVELAYNKIVDGMKKMSDMELMDTMNEIIASVEYARLNILPKQTGYYRK